MNEVTVANFRCFRDPQAARLAPLTLLVGDNSTGKTSFLALVRALWNVAFRDRVPDFKEPPYDLGSFQEIVHVSGGRAHQAPGFTAGFRVNVVGQPHIYPSAEGIEGPVRFQMTFEKDSSAPSLVVRRIESSEHWIEDATSRHQAPSFSFGTTLDDWKTRAEVLPMHPWDGAGRDLPPLSMLFSFTRAAFERNRQDVVSTRNIRPDKRDWETCESLSWVFRSYPHLVFAAAPVRSQPRRTYDPARLARDSEGAYIPMYFAHLLRSDKKRWQVLKSSLDGFGRFAGLFEEVDVRQFGPSDGDPFQIQIRQHGNKESFHNLVDVGYGVSQALPVITELLRPDASQLLLLQQPEVHLHPSAQAAFGSLLSGVAAEGRQLIVETHSDHLIDRIRMDVRNPSGKLTPEAVSILYFERRNHAVKIHSLGWDVNGNLVAKRGSTIPESYRQFFRIETRRSLGL